MPKHSLDLVPEHAKPPQAPSVTVRSTLPHVLGRVFIVLCALTLVVSSLLIYQVVLVAGQTTAGSNTSLFRQLAHLVLSKDEEIKGESEDRINVLLLGIGGPGHQGAYLTDTIILASLNPATNQVAFLSIPRDLYVDIPGLGYRKINNANAFGRETNYPGGGEQLTADVVAEVLDLPIHYYARIDFQGFAQAIDAIGTIEVTVDRSFLDREYPTTNFGYQTIAFSAGTQRMNGDTALKFVRSRHGSNGEGSDFARSERQQKVLLAAREKLLSLGTLLNPKKVSDLLTTIGTHTRTNMQLQEMLRLGQLVEDLTPEEVVTEVLDTSPGGLLVSSSTPDGAYILLPKSGTYEEIRARAKNIFFRGLLVKEGATIAVQNGTVQRGLAEDIARKLEGENYAVVAVGNADRSDYTQTVIYDLTGGQKPYTRDLLRQRFHARVVSNLPILLDASNGTSLQENLNAEAIERATQVDLLIVLGQDQEGGMVPSVTSRPIPARTS